MSDLPHSPAPEVDDDEVMPPEDLRPARSTAHPGQYQPRKRNYGCLVQVVFFLAMVGLGIYLASVTRGNNGPHKVIIGKGTAGSVSWKVEAYTDEQQARCLFLVVADQGETLTGGCISSGGDPTGADVHEAQLPGTSQWVVFGQTPAGTSRVRLPLTDNTVKVLTPGVQKGLIDKYYLYVPPHGVHTSGNATLAP